MAFLPVSRKDMEDRGWDSLDFLYISGDAYVDHPSFGHAILTRLLESEGYRVGIIAQPDWHSVEDFMRLGRPELAVLISSGVIDSMVNHYTASKKPRNEDSYSPGGKAGFRPDRADIVYANRIQEAFKGVPVIIGGIEASLRRFAHYDYWEDKVRRSILLDSKADLLIYGMGEKPLLEIARLLAKGAPISKLRNIRGTAYLTREAGLPEADFIKLPSFEAVAADKRTYAEAFMLQYNEQDALNGKMLVQQHDDRFVVQNPPAFPMTEKELDRVYSLPYERIYHPVYENAGGIPAIKEVEYSITSHRGCYGGCSFCALNFHQGRVIQKRSQASIMDEAEILVKQPGFKGYIHDVGGPTANFRDTACERQKKYGTCKNKQCLYPQPCKNLKVDHREYLELLRKLRGLRGIKKVFIRSGIRYDYLMLDENDEFFRELCEHHISGQLKVAPEHVSDRVLEKMGKPGKKVYDAFVRKYEKINRDIGKDQYLVPYLMSSHPGSDLNAAIELAVYMKKKGCTPEQVQDFYPTPGSLSTCMFYTSLDPRTMKKVYVPKSQQEKAMQRALLQFRKKENRHLVREALRLAGREDLIGFGRDCLVFPEHSGKRDLMDADRGKNGGKAARESGKKPDAGFVPEKSSGRNRRRSETRDTTIKGKPSMVRERIGRSDMKKDARKSRGRARNGT
ncbi:MAG TPA: YgiQ family radical SAM protein [Clostridia bacterium]|nr:YgiQ family radical SAM protein [Clostridia bacterium]